MMTTGPAVRLICVTGVALGLASVGLPLSLVNAAQAGDAKAGQAAFSRCATCHSPNPGINGIGPSLAGIVGSKSAAVSGFNFSPAMKNANVTWDATSLDKFLRNPNGFIHGTRMFFNVPNAADRQNIIAYLETLKH